MNEQAIATIKSLEEIMHYQITSPESLANPAVAAYMLGMWDEAHAMAKMLFKF